MKKRVFSFVMMLAVIMSLIPKVNASAVYEENLGIQSRYGVIYLEDEPDVDGWSTDAYIENGNTKLSDTLEAITVGVLAGAIASVLPITERAKIVAGAIIGAVPTMFKDSHTLYYTEYVYNATGGGINNSYKKYSVYFYYDKEKTAFASYDVYYSISTPGPR